MYRIFSIQTGAVVRRSKSEATIYAELLKRTDRHEMSIANPGQAIHAATEEDLQAWAASGNIGGGFPKFKATNPQPESA